MQMTLHGKEASSGECRDPDLELGQWDSPRTVTSCLVQSDQSSSVRLHTSPLRLHDDTDDWATPGRWLWRFIWKAKTVLDRLSLRVIHDFGNFRDIHSQAWEL
jgi:hypothetical protein